MIKFKAIFLDRDGVLIVDKHLISDISQVEMYPHVGDAISLLKLLGYKVFLVSNQAVVARGILTYSEMINLNNRILELVKKQNKDAVFDDIFLCPHHPKATLESYRQDCQCRKPNSGMLKEAEKNYNIDLLKSIIIGDRPSDIYAGKSVGCKGFQLLSGAHVDKLIESNMEYNPDWLIPDKTFINLMDAAKYIRDSK